MCLVACFLPSCYLLIIFNVISSAAADSDTSSSSIETAVDRLSVTLVRVESDSVLLEWNCFPPSVRQQLITCQARYGLLTPEKTVIQDETKDSVGGWWRFHQTQIDVLDQFLPEANSFRLTNLTTNTSYVFAMICILWSGRDDDGIGQSTARSGDISDQQYASITSNPIFFTTRSTSVDKVKNIKEPTLSAGNRLRHGPHSGTELDDHMDPIRWTSKLSQRPNQKPSLPANIILGIVCGLIGFLIINVTIVMALRKYSRWRSRQNRIRQMRFIYGEPANNYYDVT